MPGKQSIGIPTIHVPCPPELPEVLQRWCADFERAANLHLRNIAERLDTAIGARGTPTYLTDVNANGKGISNLGAPKDASYAVRAGLALRRPSEQQAWNAEGMGIQHVADAVAPKDGPNFGQVHRAIRTAVSSVTAALATVTGAFTATGTGFTGSVTGTAQYAATPDLHLVVLFLPTLSGTSNATTFTVTGLPSAIQPTLPSNQVVSITDNTLDGLGTLALNSGSSILTLLGTAGAGDWFNAGTKTLYATTVAYVR